MIHSVIWAAQVITALSVEDRGETRFTGPTMGKPEFPSKCRKWFSLNDNVMNPINQYIYNIAYSLSNFKTTDFSFHLVLQYKWYHGHSGRGHDWDWNQIRWDPKWASKIYWRLKIWCCKVEEKNWSVWMKPEKKISPFQGKFEQKITFIYYQCISAMLAQFFRFRFSFMSMIVQAIGCFERFILKMTVLELKIALFSSKELEDSFVCREPLKSYECFTWSEGLLGFSNFKAGKLDCIASKWGEQPWT